MAKYEVERKFPVADLSTLESRLIELGATISDPQLEVDVYYAHPARDFAQTDEALRIRRIGDSAYITYKGPKIDKTTKTRREIELPLAEPEETGEGWGSLLESLGFPPVAEVCKHRRKATIPWKGYPVVATLDDVQHVGTFVELELMSEESDLQEAKGCVASLAGALGLSEGERRSYLEMLLENQGEQIGVRFRQD